MNNERPDQFAMIGLHKLASQCGDGLVPELYELLSRRASMVEGNPNVTEFPAWQARPPARAVFGVAPEPRDNILPFPSGAAVAVPNKDRA
ncbi:hypothetical protein ADU59_25945 [Pararhizobium polonicum]|uniref:Uncharacterized protein n=1 Tax=Pararhizobium polonicum TaxID=1612624 RepID=A0A1C7NU55_9HYPH|nr:hypothetical protein [Pararhizobium polonicum]OBZ92500.1 hypothetical protein ADU59_25945 [Pararhizobium polonicum]